MSKKNPLKWWGWRWGNAIVPVMSTVSLSKRAVKLLIIADVLMESDKSPEAAWRRIQRSGRIVQVEFRMR